MRATSQTWTLCTHRGPKAGKLGSPNRRRASFNESQQPEEEGGGAGTRCSVDMGSARGGAEEEWMRALSEAGTRCAQG